MQISATGNGNYKDETFKIRQHNCQDKSQSRSNEEQTK